MAHYLQYHYYQIHIILEESSMIFPPMVLMHFIAGAIAIIAGFAALTFPKGSSLHKIAGNTFLLSMLMLGITAIYVAYSRTIMLSLINGIFICYLVSTSWMAIKRKAGSIGYFEKVALIAVLSVAVMLIKFGLKAAHSDTGKLSGFGPEVFYFFATIATIAAIADIRMLYRGGLTETQRIVRHLWRMCFPMFMATAAFFLGQAKLFPEPLRKMELLAIPVVLVILFSGYWLFRVQFTNFYRNLNKALNLNKKT